MSHLAMTLSGVRCIGWTRCLLVVRSRCYKCYAAYDYSIAVVMVAMLPKVMYAVAGL
jgi:hypothetical protein